MFEIAKNYSINYNILLRYMYIRENVSKLKFGDIFYYEIYRYRNVDFNEGHRFRPFIFLALDEDKIECLLASSSYQPDYVKIINDYKYSYIDCNQIFVLPISGFLSYSKALHQNQLAKILKSMFFRLNQNPLFLKHIEKAKKYLTIELGDFVTYLDKEYIVYGIDSENITLYQIGPQKECSIYLKNNYYVYYLDLVVVKKEQIKLLKQGKIEYINKIKNFKRKYRKIIRINKGGFKNE